MAGIGRDCLGREKGLWNKRVVPRTGLGVVPVVGNHGGGNKGTDGVGGAVVG